MCPRWTFCASCPRAASRFDCDPRRFNRSFYRDLYFDTADGSLSRRGIICRWRVGADDRRTLSVSFPGSPLVASEVPETDPVAAFAGWQRGRQTIARRSGPCRVAGARGARGRATDTRCALPMAVGRPVRADVRCRLRAPQWDRARVPGAQAQTGGSRGAVAGANRRGHWNGSRASEHDRDEARASTAADRESRAGGTRARHRLRADHRAPGDRQRKGGASTDEPWSPAAGGRGTRGVGLPRICFRRRLAAALETSPSSVPFPVSGRSASSMSGSPDGSASTGRCRMTSCGFPSTSSSRRQAALGSRTRKRSPRSRSRSAPALLRSAGDGPRVNSALRRLPQPTSAIPRYSTPISAWWSSTHGCSRSPKTRALRCSSDSVSSPSSAPISMNFSWSTSEV